MPLWFNHVSSLFLPFAAILFWFFTGVDSFVFSSFLIRILSNVFKRFAVPLVSILFIFWYNSLLLTSQWKFDDILFLRIIFPLIL